MVLALIPAFCFAWQNRDMPQFGNWHDDAIYFAGARSIAAQGSYRILNLPAEPYQTKFPPLYPASIAVSWLWTFPANLQIAMWLSWIWLPLLAVLTFASARQGDLGVTGGLIVSSVVAANPMLAYMSASLLSDVMFTALLLGAFLMVERERPLPAAAALLSGLAYLTRTAAMPLLITIPLFLIWRRKYRGAMVFFATMLPFIVAWTAWVATHKTPATDLTSMYYTDYVGFWLYDLKAVPLWAVAWKNFGAAVTSAGSLILPAIIDLPFVDKVCQILALAAIAGLVRLVRRGKLIAYTLFAAAYAGMLIIWHYPPTERFLIPVFPLLVTGFFVELRTLTVSIRGAWRAGIPGQRVASAFLAICAGLIVVSSVALQAFMFVDYLPGTMEELRTQAVKMRPVYDWIERNVPATANLLAYDDTLVYFATSRHAVRFTMPTYHWYRDDTKSMVDSFGSPSQLAGEHDLTYAIVTQRDFHFEAPGVQKPARERLLSHPDLEILYSGPEASVSLIRRPR